MLQGKQHRVQFSSEYRAAVSQLGYKCSLWRDGRAADTRGGGGGGVLGWAMPGTGPEAIRASIISCVTVKY